jgi:hypothetical protein
MSDYHFASFFNISECKSTIDGLESEFLIQGPQILLDQALKIIQRFVRDHNEVDLGWSRYENGRLQDVMVQDWPLLPHIQVSLPQTDDVEKKGLDPSNIQTAIILLIAQFMTAEAPSPTKNYGILTYALTELNWDSEKINSLLLGNSLWYLFPSSMRDNLHPGARQNIQITTFGFDGNLFQAGWLSEDESEQRLNSFMSAKQEIMQVTFENYPSIDLSNPTVERDFSKRLTEAVEKTEQMFLSAIESNSGLFLTLLPPTWDRY